MEYQIGQQLMLRENSQSAPSLCEVVYNGSPFMEVVELESERTLRVDLWSSEYPSVAVLSFWDGNHPMMDEFKYLFDELVPDSGEADTEDGELIRAASRLFHEFCNNGNGNAAIRCSSYDEDGDEDGEGDLKLAEFYREWLDMMDAIPALAFSSRRVRDLILDESIHGSYRYSDAEMDVYNSLTEAVLMFVIESLCEQPEPSLLSNN